VEFLADDTADVLTLSYNCFWSQVIHDPSFLKFLDTYVLCCDSYELLVTCGTRGESLISGFVLLTQIISRK
jgi:hypothetical protein